MFMGDVMNTKKKVIILVIFCLLILAGAFIADRIMSTSYFNEISYDEIMEKIENKEDKTGYNYEPWHFRYVGELAKYLYENNMLLEDYYEK